MTLEISLTRDPAHILHGSNIGQPMTRTDGVLKVTGKARYAADNHPPGMLYAVIASSCIARGRVKSLDVSAAKRHPGVLDVMTPGALDGYQVCQRIKADPRLKGVKVVLLTARGQQTDLEHGQKVGSDAYLVKPFSPLELIDKVEELITASA